MRWGRRQWCSYGAAGLATLASTRGARASEPVKVLLVGDSMIATALGSELEARLAEVPGLDVTRYGRSSSGLSRPDFFDWMARARKIRRRMTPDVVISMMGGNDAQAIFVGERSWIKWGAPTWEETYAARLEDLRGLLLPREGTWISVGLPPMRSPRFDTKLQKIDALRSAAVAARPGDHFIDTRNLLAPTGAYKERLTVGGRVKRVRAEDGIHLSLHGARLVADYVQREAVALLAARGLRQM